MMRRLFRCLERPPADGLSAQDMWCEPIGHTTEFCYVPFGGHWGTWHHAYVNLGGPQEWVFKPFVDEQTMIGGKGRMIYKQHHMPQHAVTGSVWACPNNSFRRVLSRGGAWENAIPGIKHPDEKDHDDEQSKEPETEQRHDAGTELPTGAGESAPGDGDDGQMPGVPASGEEDARLTEFSQEGGFDGNGSPVL